MRMFANDYVEADDGDDFTTGIDVNPKERVDAEFNSLMDILFEDDEETSIGGGNGTDLSETIKEDKKRMPKDEEEEDFGFEDEESEFEKFKDLFDEDGEKKSNESESSEENAEYDEDAEPSIDDLDDLLKDLDDDAVVRIGDKALNVKSLKTLSDKEEMLNNESDIIQERVDTLNSNIEAAEEVVMRNALTLSNKWNNFDKNYAMNQYHEYVRTGNSGAAQAVSAQILEYDRDAQQLAKDSETIEAMKSFRKNAEDERRLIKIKSAEKSVSPKWKEEFGTSFKQQEVLPELIKFASDTFGVSVPEAANLLSPEGILMLQHMKQVKAGKSLKGKSIKPTQSVKRSTSKKSSVKETPKASANRQYRNEDEEFEFFSQFI